MIPQYLNSTVWATLGPSKIHGIGVIAIRDIPRGTLLTDYSVRSEGREVLKVTEEEFEQILPEIRSIILDRTIFCKGYPLVFLSPNSEQSLQSFMNHSDQPNSDGERALVDIKKGEEITEDYASFYTLHDLSKKHYSWLQ